MRYKEWHVERENRIKVGKGPDTKQLRFMNTSDIIAILRLPLVWANAKSDKYSYIHALSAGSLAIEKST